jgi:hyperosmotically inducible protein
MKATLFATAIVLMCGTACSQKAANETKDAGTAAVNATVDASKTAADKIGEASKEAAQKTAEVSRDVAQKTVEASKDVAQKTKEGAAIVGEAAKDGWITTKISAKFVDERLLKGSKIDVDTKDNVVTLKGTVQSAAAKTRAADIASGTEGVKRVVNLLIIS